ncbi:MAG: hypothetical protein ACOH2J_18775 [Allorhizobium sp.]
MMLRRMLTVAWMMAASGALAQESGISSSNVSATMASLIAQGYEIKAAVPNGTKFIVFLQKDKSAYACEFSNLASSRCGSLN